MKKFEILQEWPTYNTETQSDQVLLENGANRLAYAVLPQILYL